ncbi:MAG: cytochrome-c oxidase, cbb3-type subunit III [Devosia sp.]
MSDKDIDAVTGTSTTGHEWDGIKELNTPLPRWWLWTFYGCILFAFGYMVAFPAWPLITSATSGVLGYSSRAELDKELANAAAAQGDRLAQIAATPVAEIAADGELARFASAGGKSLFKVYCSQCHGTGATGSVGYPNLNDDEWIWGGAVEQIYATIARGARSDADAETHYSLMPNFGADGILTPGQIEIVSQEVTAWSGLPGGQSTAEGAQLFAENCAGCHGDTGAGIPEAGGPSLTDQIWLYQGTLAAIEAQVNQPRHGVMPAWGARLGDTAVKQLAIYVHGLGGGQ